MNDLNKPDTEPASMRRKLSFSLPMATVAVLGAAVMVSGYLLISRTVQEQEKARFEALASSQAEKIRAHLEKNLDAVQSLGGLFDASEIVSRPEFAVFARQELSRVRGVRALSWNPWVPRQRLDDVRRLARREGALDYDFYERAADRARKPLGTRNDYVPVLYVEPFEAASDALGFDAGSDPARRRALEQARDTGKTIVSVATTLETGADAMGVLAFRPVYLNGRAPDGVSARRASIKGFAVGKFEVGQIVSEAFNGKLPDRTSVEIRDLSVAGEGGRRLYASAEVAESGGGGGLQYRTNVVFGERSWGIVVRQNAPFVDVVERSAATGFVVLVLIVTILAFLQILSARRREELISREVRNRSDALAQEIARSASIQENLAESEKKYRALFDHAPVGIFFSGDDAIGDANAAAADMLGAASPDELIGRTRRELVDPAYHEAGAERTAAIRRGEPVDPYEIEMVRLDGRRIKVLAAAAAITLEDETFVIHTFRDMSSEFRAREELLESEQRYRSLIELFPDCVILTKNGIVSQLNAAGIALHGAGSEDDLIGMKWIDLVDASFHDKVYSRRELMSSGALAEETEFLMKRLDGSTFWAVARAIQVSIAGENYIMTVCRDITPQREAARALEQSETNYRQLAELAPDAVTVQNEHGTLFANEAAAKLFGFDTAADIVGTDLVDILRPDERERVRESRRHILDGAPPVVGKELTFVNARNEWKSIVSSAALVEWDGRPACLVVNQDVTGFRKAQDELEAANAELARSNEDLAQFAYVASHDLKEPLRMVSSYCELLATRYTDKVDDAGREYIRYATEGATRMRSLIDDLLIYSRIGRGGTDRAPVDLRSVVDEALDNLTSAIEEAGAEIEIGDLPALAGYRIDLVRLFQNLIGNAVKFRSDDPPRIRIDAQVRGGFAEIRVSDNGIGIAPEFQDQVFGVFKRLHKRTEYDGTGIGLAICEKIVAQMGGKIGIESEVGAGTTFVITLPA